MALNDYSVPHDLFEVDLDKWDFVAEFGFPCCFCSHNMKSDYEYPCSECGHNANAEQEGGE